MGRVGHCIPFNWKSFGHGLARQRCNKPLPRKQLNVLEKFTLGLGWLSKQGKHAAGWAACALQHRPSLPARQALPLLAGRRGRPSDSGTHHASSPSSRNQAFASLWSTNPLSWRFAPPLADLGRRQARRVEHLAGERATLSVTLMYGLYAKPPAIAITECL